MTFLNPLALLFIATILWIFKDIFLDKYQLENNTFILEHKRHHKQTKLLLIALVFIVLALSRPAITNEINREKFDANEYILALDASFSMQMTDVKPSRYLLAKKNIIALLNRDTNDRFTLFAFTKNPLLISPPTTDKQISISALNALEPKYILTKGTSLLSLINQVATLEQEHKSLILFSDGGEEHNLKYLINILKSSAITLNIVAIGSIKGSVVTKDDKVLKDENSHLVISRINPILKDLATLSGGFYFELNNNRDISEALYEKMRAQDLTAKELSTEVVSYKELYFIPLLMAFILLLIALTKVEKFLPFLALLFILHPFSKAQASLLDFHYSDVAKEAYDRGDYIKAQNYFKRLTPSQYSYMSIANAYYKNKQYKNSLRYYSQIKSKNPHIKSTVFYNMANAAFRLKKYQRAYELYKQSLGVEYSKEAYENMLILLQLNKKSKVNVADMLPTADSKKVKNITKKIDNKKEDQEGGGTSSGKQRDAQGSNGGSGEKSKKKSENSAIIKGDKNKFRMGYNAYELINKGYVNEKHPW
jgi:Ca-activated chloride channel family protein